MSAPSCSTGNSSIMLNPYISTSRRTRVKLISPFNPATRGLNPRPSWSPIPGKRGVPPYEALARLLVKHRAQLGLAQQQLAERMGTSHSAVSRMESRQHPTKPETLRRLAAALELRLVVGFESGPKERPTRELITL
jgi:hypothetical protein